MKWAEFRVHATQEAVEPISNLLHEAGAAGVSIEDPYDLVMQWGFKYGELYELSPGDYPTEGVMIKAYFPMNERFEETIATVRKRVLALREFDIDLGKAEMDYVQVDEEDWATAWKKYYHPVKITDRITVLPTWEEYEPTEGELIIELDPGMAFGTGTHATTMLSIQALEQVVKAKDAVIDVGTGSGVLAIAAYRLGATSITALDLDDVAVASAQSNFALNGAEALIDARQNHLLEGVPAETADVVVANILAEVIVTFTDDAYGVIRPGGHFITSGVISRKKDEVSEAIRTSGFEVVEAKEMDDWVAIIARKPQG
ncbi:50S ribosomal protein L11 methyltransferase [Shouchella shacheensis]|uniref:50S ribosomal protein L11 methyltransferase n=1 Tax=Shouchella shacheensis TaxID=1649580 RepID=UPI00073FE699|nr:50S ribosomal protein L11 methyltransferase [Shouchella shacheensis]